MTADSDAWIALRKAVREAHRLGASFRIIGNTVVIYGDLPRDLQEAMPAGMLRQYLGAAQVDAEAIAFLGQLSVTAVLIEDVDAGGGHRRSRWCRDYRDRHRDRSPRRAAGAGTDQ